MRKYHLMYELVKTEPEAIAMCDRINKEHTRYMRQKHPAHFTTWSASDGSYDGFVVLYYR